MPEAIFLSGGGSAIDHVAVGDVAEGQVIVTADQVAIAKLAISSGDTGALHVGGLWRMAKATGAIAIGADCYWDDTNNQVVTEASGTKYLGTLSAAGVSGTLTCDVIRSHQSEDDGG